MTRTLVSPQLNTARCDFFAADALLMLPFVRGFGWIRVWKAR